MQCYLAEHLWYMLIRRDNRVKAVSATQQFHDPLREVRDWKRQTQTLSTNLTEVSGSELYLANKMNFVLTQILFPSNLTFLQISHSPLRDAPTKGETGKAINLIHAFFFCNYIFLLVYISIKVNSKPIEYLIQCFSANYWHSVQSIWALLLFLLSCLKCCKAELF